MPELVATVSAWLVTYFVHSTVLLGAAALFERLRASRPALRELLWRSAILGALATATLQGSGVEPIFSATRFRADAPATALPPSPPPRREAPAANTSTLAFAPPAAAGEAREASLSSPVAPGPGARAAAWIVARWPVLLVLVWLAGAALALLRLGVLAFLACRDLRGRAPAPAEIEAEIESLARGRTAGLRRAPALSVAPALAGPVALPGGEIVLPAWTDAIDGRRRRALLAHELAHQLRRDPWWIAALLVLQALLWPQPLLGVARRRLARIAELEADAWAARSTGDARAVAECLADCAERMLARRPPLYGAAMADPDSAPGTLLHRIDRLLEGETMIPFSPSVLVRAGVAAGVLSTALFLPGCDVSELRADMGGSSIRVSVEGDDTTLSVSRAGYRLKLHAEGEVTFLDDESDVASIEAGGELWIREKENGVEREYSVVRATGGGLARTYEVDGAVRPLDDEGRAWIAAVLPRVFRETGYDAEARVGRLMRRGGPELVLAEVELTRSDWGRATYLGALFATGPLAPADLERAVLAMESLESDYEMRRMLETAIRSQKLDAALFARLLGAATRGIESDYEMAELLVGAIGKLPDAAEARAAWGEAAATLESDYELGRTLGEAFERKLGDSAYAAGLVALAARELESDYELRQALARASSRIGEPGLAAAAIAATASLDSSYERREALIGIAEGAPLDGALLASFLDSAAGIESGWERLQTLEAVASKVAADPDLSRRYRELARDLADHERGQALAALDDSAR